MSTLTSHPPGHDDPLSRLPYAKEASFDSYANQHRPICLPNTRVDLLNQIGCWIDSRDERSVFWLRGLAGTGKSTIAQTIAQKFHGEKRLAASYFFTRGGPDVSGSEMFVTTIALQLAINVPASRKHICDALIRYNNITSQSLRDQWQHLVLHPLSLLEVPSSLIIVVDALDECSGTDNIRLIIQLLSESRGLLRILLTSRPELPVRNEFSRRPSAQRQEFVLHDISPPIVDHDIGVFLEHNLRFIAQECNQPVGWPGKEVILRLCRDASGLFIWAATACRFIAQGGPLAADRLETILTERPTGRNSSTDDSFSDDMSGSDTNATLPEKQLNSIYLTILEGTARRLTKHEKRRWYNLLKETLGAIILLRSPLSTSSLAELLGIPLRHLHQASLNLHSILNVTEDIDRPLYIHHPSLRDFLLNERRCGESFWVDETQVNATLAKKCMQLMKMSLRQNICGIDAPEVYVAEMHRPQPETIIKPEMQYACLYWIVHVHYGKISLCDDGEVHSFLIEHYLHWLEVICWMGRVSEGIYAIALLESLAAVSIYSFHVSVSELHRVLKLSLTKTAT